jgi:4-amino-4-deoxy-L-arabinose transferase-like glycosyltransferase
VSLARHLPLAMLLALVVRLPFWAEALRTPVDGDTAIVGLMARHPGHGTTLWGQPYGSPLDAWLAAPFVAALGPTTAALRLVYFLLGLGLVPVAYFLGGALHPRAALPAAVLMACPPPYFLLLAALPPPLYPTTLILCGVLLILALRTGEGLASGARPVGGLVAWGLLAGLALWTHLMAASVVLVAGAFLLGRARGRATLLAALLVPLLVASAPLWTRGAGWAARDVSLSDRDETLAGHLAEVLPEIHRPLGGLLGTHVPVVPDVGDPLAQAPRWAAGGLVLVYGVLIILAVRMRRGSAGVRLLLAAAALAVLAFPFPLRSGPNAIRFLTPAYLCILPIVIWVPLAGRQEPEAVARGLRRAWIVVLGLATLHLTTGTRLLESWRQIDRADPPFFLPDLAPARAFLEARRIGHAYASYGPAYRLSYESGERLVVSQPWNERFRHYPLPYLDEVRFAKNVAWLLTPDVPTDLPPPRAFEDLLGQAGGTWERSAAGPATVYHDFAPPFSPRVEPLPSAGEAGDGDLATRLAASGEGAVTFALASAQPLDGVTFIAPADGPPLLRSMNVEVSADGASFEIVARRRRREERRDLRWVNGHPQFVIDHDLIAVPLGGRAVAALRVSPYASDEPWQLAEILLHPAEAPAARTPWDEWLDPTLDWSARRRALAAQPLRVREDWYYRLRLASRLR